MTSTGNDGAPDKAGVLDAETTATRKAVNANQVAPAHAPSSPQPAPPGPTRAAESAPAPVPPAKSKWQTYGTPLLVVLLAAAVLITITRNWNAWEGGRVEQVRDDAYVRGDITPLGTKVAGIVRDVKVADYQQIHRGDVLAELESNDYQAQAAQATAAVDAARAAIEDNRRQLELEDARIQKALAGVDEANAQIGSAQDGIEAVRAGVVRAQKERKRQEALFQAQSTTEQKLEQAVAEDEQLAAQLSSSESSLK